MLTKGTKMFRHVTYTINQCKMCSCQNSNVLFRVKKNKDINKQMLKFVFHRLFFDDNVGQR